MPDLLDGTVIVELVQALTGDKLLDTYPSPSSREEAVGNLQAAMDALTLDGVDLVGISAPSLHAGDMLQLLR